MSRNDQVIGIQSPETRVVGAVPLVRVCGAEITPIWSASLSSSLPLLKYSLTFAFAPRAPDSWFGWLVGQAAAAAEKVVVRWEKGRKEAEMAWLGTASLN